MTTSQTEIESQVTELSAMAFEAFCADISVMFGLEAQCKQRQAAAETVEDLNKYFEELAAVVSVEAEGTFDGTFHLVLDRAGLFTLAGITFPLTQEQILKKTKDGSTEDAEALSNALADAAKVLIEAWDKLFHEKFPGHDQFLKTNTFIGNPWEKPQENIGLSADEKFLSVLCEMTVGPYPTFNCAAIFPKTIFAGPTEQQAEPQEKTDSEAEDKPEQAAQIESEDKAEEITEGESDQEAEPQAEENPATSPEENTESTAEGQTKAEEAEPQAEEETQPQNEEETEPQAQDKTEEKAESQAEEAQAEAEEQTEPAAVEQGDETDTDSADEPVDEKVPTDESKEQPVSKTIRNMTSSPAVLPGETDQPAAAENVPVRSDAVPLTTSAEDVMQKNIGWIAPENSVQDALTMLQQNDAGYLMVGSDRKLEGIVSRSDINGALSPYLQPMFAKWRRPLDDATLQIKIKWIMTRTIRTVNPDTPLAAVMEIMCQFGWRALPVIDQQGTVRGLVTVFDIFRALLKADPNTSVVGNPIQAPMLA
jgi:CBS domain-containing protein